VWTTAATCAVTALALAGSDSTLDELADGLEAAGAPEEVADAVRRSATSELESLELDERNSMGYTVRTMTAGLWAHLNAKSFETTLLEVINAGGDTDTNGAVVGAILGARFGVSEIPGRWLEHLPDRGALERLADRLWDSGSRGVGDSGI
jgi:ADP-ribosylglycohydrolase